MVPLVHAHCEGHFTVCTSHTISNVRESQYTLRKLKTTAKYFVTLSIFNCTAHPQYKILSLSPQPHQSNHIHPRSPWRCFIGRLSSPVLKHERHCKMPTVSIISPPPTDRPVYTSSFPALTGRHNLVEQLVLHAALDMLDEAAWLSRDCYLKDIDRHNGQTVSAYCTPSGFRFLLLHDGRQTDGVRAFFVALHDLFAKTMLNPLYDERTPAQISSPAFHENVVIIAKRFL